MQTPTLNRIKAAIRDNIPPEERDGTLYIHPAEYAQALWEVRQLSGIPEGAANVRIIIGDLEVRPFDGSHPPAGPQAMRYAYTARNAEPHERPLPPPPDPNIEAIRKASEVMRENSRTLHEHFLRAADPDAVDTLLQADQLKKDLEAARAELALIRANLNPVCIALGCKIETGTPELAAKLVAHLTAMALQIQQHPKEVRL